MSRWRRLGRFGIIAAVLACGAWSPGYQLHAQDEWPVAEQAADPVTCWWKTDKDAVLIGEHFRLTITCGLVATDTTMATVDPKQLDAAALSLTPFEVLEGTQHDEISSPPWRYVQHDYTLRIVGEGYFGQDVDIPALKITYGLQSRATGEADGPDQTLVFPSLPIRVLSLVPKGATGIRDSDNGTFGDAEARLLQSRGAFIVAGVFFGLAVVLGAAAARKVLAGYRERAQVRNRPLRPSSILRACDRALGALKAEVEAGGWSRELAGRALAIFRIAGAIALGGRVAEVVIGTRDGVDAAAVAQTGQVVVRRGLLGRSRALLSAPTTADAIARRLADPAQVNPRLRPNLEAIQDSLRLFSGAQYGQSDDLNAVAFDEALDRGREAMRRLRVSGRTLPIGAGA